MPPAINRILLDEKGLSHRGKMIQQLLRPLSNRGKEGPPFVRGRTSTQSQILGANDAGPPGGTDHRSWRCATFLPDFRMNYFEQWDQSGSRDSFRLMKAYLHLYRRDRSAPQEKQFLCLHCDPELDPSEKNIEYKRGPHLHVSVAGFPFDKAHLALHVGYLDDVLASLDSLMTAMKHAVTMIRVEVLEQYRTIKP